jgi:hypothetical protein
MRGDEAESGPVRERRRGHHARRSAPDARVTWFLSCPARALAEGASILKRLYELGGAPLARVAEDLLSSLPVADAFSHALERAIAAKGRMDRTMQTVLGLFNLPSRGDLSRLTTKLEAIQGSLVNLHLKMDRLMSARAPRSARPRRKHASPGAPEAE